MGWLAALTAKLALSGRLRALVARAAPWLAGALLFAALALALRCYVSRHEQAAVLLDRAEANASANGAALAADRGAGADKDARDRAFEHDQDQLKEKADAAAAAGDSPLDALFDGLR